MALEQALLTWIHITSAAIWVGGSLFIGVVFAPILKKLSMPVEERIQLMVQVGRRFNKLAMPALFILIATGMYQAHLVLQKTDILYETSYGHVLIINCHGIGTSITNMGSHYKRSNMGWGFLIHRCSICANLKKNVNAC